MKVFKNIDMFDILMFLGCSLIGYGLFLLYGLGVALSILGAIFLFLGLIGSIIPIFIKKAP